MPSHWLVPLVYIDVIFALLLIGLITRRIVELWFQRHRGLTGAKLHVHLAGLFAFMTLIPSVIVSIFCALFLNLGVDAWFGKPVKKVVEEANLIATAYLKEHQKAINIDAHALVNILRPQMQVLVHTPILLNQILNYEAETRGLGELLVFNQQGKVLGKSYLTFSLELEKILTDDLERVDLGENVIRESKDRVRSMIKIDPITHTYLFIGKLIDPVVLGHLNRTKEAVSDYRLLSQEHSELQITFIAFFSIIVLLLLAVSIWSGLSLSNVLIAPIRCLIQGAESVSQGDLSIIIKHPSLNNEIDDLILSFNKMTKKLKKQHQELILSQRQAAWADIARKIAHEIKNPLTPIQLAAERLKKKYLKEIQSDSQTFQVCIDTIIRQVDHIERLVREFSSFARMSQPKVIIADISLIAQECITLQEQAYPDIKIYLTCEEKILWPLDTQHMSQVFTNILQNSIQALCEKGVAKKKIWFHIHKNEAVLNILIQDNGPGLPASEEYEKFLEPYYTTRPQGTGLGLAIVAKIISDHNGSIELGNRKEGGAWVRIILSTPTHKI